MNTLGKKMIAVIGALLAASITILPQAQAQALNPGRQSGFYVGGSVGLANAKSACDGLSNIGFSGNCDNDDTGWKIYGGYQVNENLAVEGGYHDLGESKASGTLLGLAADSKSKAKGVHIAAVGILPLTAGFGLFAKLGAHRSEVKSEASVGGASAATSGRSGNWLYGLGLRYDVNWNLGLRAEWEHFQKVGDDQQTGTSDIDLYSLGLTYRF